MLCGPNEKILISVASAINILASINASKHPWVLCWCILARGIRSLSSMCSTVPIVPLSNRCDNHILNIVIDGQINGWFLHHFHLLVGSISVISNHLFDVCLVALAVGTSCIVVGSVMRVILLLSRSLGTCLLRVSSVLPRLHSVVGPLDQGLVDSNQLVYQVVHSLLVVSVLKVCSIAALQILCEDLFQVLVKLLCPLVFREVLLVVLDQLLDLVLKLLLGQASI